MRWYSVTEGKRIPRKKGQPANSKKHSDLYTDENPKGTIHGLGFKDEATARSSVSKIRKSGRSHAHKIQAAVAMEQRAKAAGKSGPASIYRKYINSMKKKTKKKNEAAGVGIVTKQNATKDVPVGGEYMNVKKLGLGKGKPKELHKKARKNSTPNKMFNLGMAETINEDVKLYELLSALGHVARTVAPKVLPKINPSNIGATGAGAVVGNQIGKAVDKAISKKPNSSKNTSPAAGPTILPKIVKPEQGKTDYKKHKTVEPLKIGEVSAKDLSKDTEVYVDMDGVLADFFGAWKKLIGKDWREIKDLDGALQRIRDKDDFWLNIPVTPNAMNLLSLVKQLKGSYNILSAPLPNDPNSEPHKRQWIEKNLSGFPPSKVIITSNKSVHATQPDGTPNILIDDFGKNIAKWEAAGGVGFKHKDHKFERTVKNLKQYMDQDTKEGIVSNVKDAATAGKLIYKYHQTGSEQDAFAAIKHGWQWIKNPKMRSKIVNLVKRYAEKQGQDWPKTVAHIKKNTGIDVSKVNEADMSKSSIKKIRKTVDKMDDKPKAKKSISKWAKGKFDDPKAAMFAIATNMRKRKEGKPIDPPGRESYARSELPQIKEKHLQKLPHTMETILIEDIVPVQKERVKENHKRQLKKVLEGKFSPIVLDCHNRIVNGHHRYDIVKMLQMESITVAKLPLTLEYILEVTSEGDLIPNPQRSILVKKNDGYDHYKLATHVANIKKMSPKVVDRNKQDIYIQFYGGEKEKDYMMKNLKRLGFGVQDADGYKDTHFDETIEGSYVLKVRENFADGKKKGRKGLSKRVGIPKGASVTQLRKIAKNSTGERRRMAHWQANMKSGRKKKGK